MKKPMFLLFGAAVLGVGCASADGELASTVSANSETPPAVTQGIKGFARWLEGDFDPGPGPHTEPPGTITPLSREIRIYALTTWAQATHLDAEVVGYNHWDDFQTALVATTHSHVGNFEIALPPGDYSVLIADAGSWYSCEDWGHEICAVHVEAGQVAEVGIDIDYKASK